MSFLGDGSEDPLGEYSSSLGWQEEQPPPRYTPPGRRNPLSRLLAPLAGRWRRMRRRQRRIFIAGVALPLALLLLMVFVCGGSENDASDPLGDDWDLIEFEEEPTPASLGEPMSQDPSTGSGIPVAADVSAMVEATVTAIRLTLVTPTPDPTPTIDIRSTIQARASSGAFSGSPQSSLRRHELRSAYLSPSEISALERLGPDVWLSTLAYSVLHDVLGRERASLSGPYLAERSELMRSYVFGFTLQSNYASQGDLNSLVVEFIAAFRSQLTSLATASTEMQSLARLYSDVLPGDSLPPDSYAESRRLLLLLSELADDFHNFMSSYGCSICGELYRSDIPPER